MCRDEEALRTELLKYKQDGLTPGRVPPLVQQHLPSIPPTSKNKMFNAMICSKDFGGEWTEKTSAPTKSAAKADNRTNASSLLATGRFSLRKLSWFKGTRSRSIDAYLGEVQVASALKFLKAYTWFGGRDSAALEREYLKASLESGKVTSCQVLIPQADAEGVFDLRGSGLSDLAVVLRTRASESRIGVYSDPAHRKAAQFISGVTDLEQPSQSLTNARNNKSVVLMLYFFKEAATESDALISVGFGIQFPGSKANNKISWTVADKSRSNEVVVPLKQASSSVKTGKSPTKRSATTARSRR